MLSVLQILKPLTLGMFRKPAKPFSVAMSVFAGISKSLVEQSNPYMYDLLSTTSLKLFPCGALFCALVLSNAYKNDNIQKLIYPSKFQPLKI